MASVGYDNPPNGVVIGPGQTYQVVGHIRPLIKWKYGPESYCAQAIPSDMDPGVALFRLALLTYLDFNISDVVSNENFLTIIEELIKLETHKEWVGNLFDVASFLRDGVKLSSYVLNTNFTNSIEVQYNGKTVNVNGNSTTITVPSDEEAMIQNSVAAVLTGLAIARSTIPFIQAIIDSPIAEWSIPITADLISAAVLIPLQPIIWGCNGIFSVN